MALSYDTCTSGQRALGGALVRLPKHPADQDQPRHLAALLEQFGGVPDEVLCSVAAEIIDRWERGQLRQQPRYDQLKEMTDAALAVHNELAALIATRQ